MAVVYFLFLTPYQCLRLSSKTTFPVSELNSEEGSLSLKRHAFIVKIYPLGPVVALGFSLKRHNLLKRIIP